MNILGSVQIAILIVSSELRIRRFTSMAERMFNLIATDVGWPIGHIKPNIDCPDVETIIHEAIDTVSAVERQVQDRQGNWFSLRRRPYENVDSRIDGAVLWLSTSTRSGVRSSTCARCATIRMRSSRRSASARGARGLSPDPVRQSALRVSGSPSTKSPAAPWASSMAAAGRHRSFATRSEPSRTGRGRSTASSFITPSRGSDGGTSSCTCDGSRGRASPPLVLVALEQTWPHESRRIEDEA